MTSTTSLVPAAEPQEPNLIKTDVLGRMHRTPEQRERILDEYERSGLSGPKFAALCGVKYQTLAAWLTRRKGQRQTHPKRQPRRKSNQVQWLEASVQPVTAANASLLLQLPGGGQTQLSNCGQIALVAALLRALQKPC
jgi:DNA-binding transcriptional regulator YiaG